MVLKAILRGTAQEGRWWFSISCEHSLTVLFTSSDIICLLVQTSIFVLSEQHVPYLWGVLSIIWLLLYVNRKPKCRSGHIAELSIKPID